MMKKIFSKAVLTALTATMLGAGSVHAADDVKLDYTAMSPEELAEILVFMSNSF